MVNFSDIIDSLFKELNVSGTPEELLQMKQKMENHFYEVILKVTLENLTEEQKKEFLNILRTNPDPSAEIQKLSASVPGLLGQITDAIDRELNLLRTLLKKK